MSCVRYLGAAVLAASFVAGCATDTGPMTLEKAASQCAGRAYDQTFTGGDYFNTSDRSRVLGALSSESEGGGRVSQAAMQQLTNIVGAQGAQQVAARFGPCLSSAARDIAAQGDGG